MRGCFVSATGTDVGKTVFARALTLALCAQGQRVAALKPVETGFVDPEGSDAVALARAARRPELADCPGFYRAEAPLAPAAIALSGGPPPPDPGVLSAAVRHAAAGSEVVVVEGAGGLLVPLDATHTFADVAAEIGLPVVLVAPDGLGVLSHVLTAVECAVRRRLVLRAVVLMELAPERRDLSAASNAALLQARVPCEVHRFPRAPLADAPLGRFAEGLSWLAGLADG